MAKVPVIDIRPCDLETVREILRRHVPNHEVLAFGSRVKWTARQYSDLDLAIRSDEEIPWETISAIKNELSESRLPMMVDVLDMASVSETFRGIIEEEYAVVQEANTTKPLGEVAEITMGQSPPGNTYNKTGDGLPFYQGVADFQGRYPKRRVYCTAPTRFAERGDILLSVRAPIGRVNLAIERCAIGRGLARIRATDSKDQTFLEFALCGESANWDILESQGSVFGSASKSDLMDLPIPWPAKKERHFAARILGALDDKIELNRRMNKTLEAMAQAIFKSWFVDFDPVHAKTKRRPTGLPPEIATLFPAQFQDSELGKIPRGWEVKALDEIAEFLNGLALQKRRPQAGEDDLPVIKIAELRSGVTARSERASAGIPEKYVIKDGDVIFSWSGSLLQTIWTGGAGALNQHLFKVSSSQYPKWFYYFWVDRHLPDFQKIAADKATTMGHIQRHHLTEAKTVVPDARLLKSADKHLSPFFAKIVATARAGRFTAKLRDTLLPDIISGGIRVEIPENR